MVAICPRPITIPAWRVTWHSFCPQKVGRQAWSLAYESSLIPAYPDFDVVFWCVFCTHWALDWCPRGSYSLFRLHRLLNIVSSNSNIQCIIENRHGEIYSLVSVPLPELEKVNDLNPDYSEERGAAWIESHHQSFPFSCSCEPWISESEIFNPCQYSPFPLGARKSKQMWNSFLFCLCIADFKPSPSVFDLEKVMHCFPSVLEQ